MIDQWLFVYATRLGRELGLPEGGGGGGREMSNAFYVVEHKTWKVLSDAGEMTWP